MPCQQISMQRKVPTATSATRLPPAPHPNLCALLADEPKYLVLTLPRLAAVAENNLRCIGTGTCEVLPFR